MCDNRDVEIKKVPQGYYPDPATNGEYERWWTGAEWMDETKPRGGPTATAVPTGLGPLWREHATEADLELVSQNPNQQVSVRDLERWQYKVVSLGTFFAKDRLVFGGIVPWDTLWRTGANEPTIIRLSQAAEIAGLAVEPGKYSLYTVPSEDQWVLVVNASTSQWGQTRDQPMADGGTSNNAYTAAVEAQEVGRAPISTLDIEFTEQFEAVFGAPTDQSVDLFLDWANTRLVVPLRFVGDP